MSIKFSAESKAGYETDETAETEGIRVEINDQVAFIIRRAGGRNHAFRRAVQALRDKYRRRLDAGVMSDEEIDRLVYWPAFSEHVLVDWEGVTDSMGDDVPFSREACREFFDAVPDVYATLRDIASDISYFRLGAQERAAEDLGNS